LSTCGSLEVRDKVTSSSLRHWVDQARPTYQGNRFMSSSYFHCKHYQDSVTCDVVDIDQCHILLRRLWQHDVDATHQGRDNIYVFTWKGKRVVMRPIPPTTRSTKKRVPSPGIMRNQSDRNSRASSFEEEGTDVGHQKGKARQTACQKHLTCQQL